MFSEEDFDYPGGFLPVCLDFGEDWHKIDYDTLTRCHCYLARHALEITPKAAGLEFDFFPMRWHHFGSSYPCFGIPSNVEFPPGTDKFGITIELEKAFNEFILRTGMEKLAELSSDERMTWADIHDVDEP